MRQPSALPYLGLFALCLIFLVAGGNSAVGAEEDPATEAETTVAPIEDLPAAPTPEELRYTRDLVEEIRVAREEQIAAVDRLKEQLLSTQDPVLAIELQKQIQEFKLRGQMELLQIQIRHARRAGREELALDAEESVEAMRQLLDDSDQEGRD